MTQVASTGFAAAVRQQSDIDAAEVDEVLAAIGDLEG